MEAARSIPGSRRRSARHLAVGLGVCGLTAACLLIGGPARGDAAGGTGAGGSAVVVDLPGAGGARAFSAAEFREIPGSVSGTYTVRAHPGEAGERVGKSGLPVRTLIEEAGADPDAIGYLTVPRADGTSAYLPAADFAEEPPFPEGPALVSVEGSGTTASARFFRPVLAEGEANAEDNIATPAAGSLAIGVRDGAILAVGATASPTSASAGTAIEFTATASGALPGEALSYSWSFGDGTSAEGARVTHPFTAAGSYRVRVTAVGSEESGGESAPVTVVVGNPPAGPGVGAGPEAPKKKTKPRGTGGRSNGSGKGGYGGDGGRGTSGAGRKGSGGASAGRGAQGGGRKNSGAGKGGGAAERAAGDADAGEPGAGGEPTSGPEPVPFSEPLPAEPAPSPEAAATPPDAAAVPQPAGASAPARGDSAGATAPSQTVRGQLVADLFEAGSDAPGSPGSSPALASQSFASAPSADGDSIPVTALLAACLLTAGVLFEWRRRPGRGLR